MKKSNEYSELPCTNSGVYINSCNIHFSFIKQTGWWLKPVILIGKSVSSFQALFTSQHGRHSVTMQSTLVAPKIWSFQ